MNREKFLKSALAGCAGMTLAGATRFAAAAKDGKLPNIVFMLADDLGYADLGCYGQKKIKTPNLDKLAAEGMRLTQFYSGNPVCAPSRCALMTGLHSGHGEVRNNRQVGGVEGWKLGATTGGQYPLSAEAVTFPMLLKKAGYITGAFGKWGLGRPDSTGAPHLKGIDDFFGYNCQRQAHTYYPNHLWHNQEIVRIPENENGAHGKYSHDMIVDRALQWLRDNKDKPFFLYMPVTVPHVSLHVPEDSLAQYKGAFEETPFPGDASYDPCPTPHAAYAAMVSRLDRDAGRVAKLLDELGLAENTLFIFTSDNGPAVNAGSDPKFFENAGPFRGNKGMGYEGGIRVPFIARWRGTIKPGVTSDQVGAFWDMMPTFCELAGIEAPKNIDGVSLLPTLLGQTEKQKQHDYLYWELGKQQAARKGDWKAYRPAPNLPLELYNLKTDIGEKKDLAAQKPDVAGEMERLIESAHVESEVFPLLKAPAKKPAAAMAP
ncbi:MAG: arylsulfatase [Candidatus Sumerlaeota bacterium]|nr:arylsulfatase [Candidatus Sumerlaeota bacterium]